VRFSIGAFAGRPAEQEQWRRLLWALAGSLLLHWGVWAVLQRVPAGRLAGAAGPARLAVVATLQGAGQEARPVVIEAPDEGIAAAVSEARAALADPPELPEPGEPAAAAQRVATLGQRRLEAQLPPYLLAPFSSDAPQGPWYFRRSELTVAPTLQGEPLIRWPEKAGSAAPWAGKVVLRVFVSAAGVVDRIEVANSSLPAAFDEAAGVAFSRVRFRPGEIEGVAVNSETSFEIVFDGSDTDSSQATDQAGIRHR
jgi:TonB family protein